MRPIPLSLLSLYADLQQRLQIADVEPASISRKKVSGKTHVYAVIKDGSSRRQKYIGPEENPETAEIAERHKRAARERAQLKKTVLALKSAGIPAPGVQFGQILESVALAGLFNRGAILVGTVAYQQFPCLIGAYLPEGAARTEDADFSATRFAIPNLAKGPDLQAILQRADRTFVPKFAATDKLPSRFVSENGLIVEMLTTRGRNDGPVQIPALGCAAIPLRFMEYLLEDPIEAVVLYGAGVRIKVPDPARYAIHKLIVHQVRTNPIKAQKDLWQAKELIEVYRTRDPDHLDDMIEDATRRGRTWAKLVKDGLRLAEG